MATVEQTHPRLDCPPALSLSTTQSQHAIHDFLAGITNGCEPLMQGSFARAGRSGETEGAVAAPSRPLQRGGAPHGWMTTTESELLGLPSITLSDQIR